ncbi:MAG: RND transporter [Deltaproteobacteria bacterium]|nr:MAG: RND transporter [Deltaproteobacteria bacterium]
MLLWFDQLPWAFVVFACLTLGLAPFNPPHIVEKIGMLREGELKKPLDIFDFFFHLVPWLILVGKVVATLIR